MTRLVLLRHGQTPFNAERRFQGQLDPDLDEVGLDQAVAAAGALAPRGPAAIVSSDLRRATRTAAPLAAATGLAVTNDSRLREIDLGNWQGLTRAEAEESDPVGFAAWAAGEEIRRPGGESPAEVADRMVAGLTAAVESVAPGAVLVVVSHGFAIRAGLARLLDPPAGSTWRDIPSLANGTWVEVTVDEEGRWQRSEL